MYSAKFSNWQVEFIDNIENIKSFDRRIAAVI